jgi:hypothetical protein
MRQNCEGSLLSYEELLSELRSGVHRPHSDKLCVLWDLAYAKEDSP